MPFAESMVERTAGSEPRLGGHFVAHGRLKASLAFGDAGANHKSLVELK